MLLDIPAMCCRAVFMATGMAAATLTHTAAALGIAPTAAVLTWPASDVANSGALLAATAVLTFMGLARAAQAVGSRYWGCLVCCCSVTSLRHLSVVRMACLGLLHRSQAATGLCCGVCTAADAEIKPRLLVLGVHICLCRSQSRSLWSC